MAYFKAPDADVGAAISELEAQGVDTTAIREQLGAPARLDVAEQLVQDVGTIIDALLNDFRL
jgi:hypothetical protein